MYCAFVIPWLIVNSVQSLQSLKVQDEGDWSDLMAFDIIVFLSELAFTDSQRIDPCKWEFYMQINLPALCTFIDGYSPRFCS
jgi:hypothetical protein